MGLGFRDLGSRDWGLGVWGLSVTGEVRGQGLSFFGLVPSYRRCGPRHVGLGGSEMENLVASSIPAQGLALQGVGLQRQCSLGSSKDSHL